MPNINGILTPNGTNGWYKLNLNITEFAYNGIYTLNITACKKYYELKSITIPIIPTNFTLDKGNVQVYWKENITLNAYYEDISAEPYAPINGAIVSYTIVELPNINGTLPPNGTDGWYRLNINSTEFAYNGTCTLNITAYKKYYEPKSITIPITINQIPTNFTLDKENVEVYWNDILTLNAYYEDISAEPYAPINDATVNYSIVELPNINGTLISNGINGWYKLDLNSTKLGNVGSYNMKITAYKRGYEIKSITIPMTIILRELNITLSNEFSNNNEIQIYTGEDLAFDIILNDSIDTSAVIGANVCLIFENKNYNFNEDSSGYYSLSINSFKTFQSDLSNKLYSAEISVIRDFYTSENVQISINVRNRIIIYSLSATNLNKKQINIVQGKDAIIEIKLTDPTKGNMPITGATVIMKNIDEKKSYIFKEITSGIYRYTFSTEEYEGFMETHNLACKIIISKQYYLSESTEIIIKIELEEIISGLPTFYFVNLIFAVGTGFSILIGYLSIEKKKIIKFSKIIKKLKKRLKRK